MNFYFNICIIFLLIFTFDAKNDDYDSERLQEMLNDLKNDKKLDELLEDYFIERNKKNDKNHHDMNHKDDLVQETKSCYEKMNVKDNLIIHSKESIENGAEFIDVKMVPKSTSEIVLHEKCMTLCCNTKSCDTSLVALKPSDYGYRCYLFNCSSKCVFASHGDYSIMTMYDFNPSDVQTTKNNIKNEQIINKKCHNYEFTCNTTLTCIPNYDVCNSFNDCEDGSDEIDCEKLNKVQTKLNKKVSTTTITTTSRKKETTTKNLNENESDIIDLTNDLLNNYQNDDAEMYENEKTSNLKEIEELLHKQLIESFKPKNKMTYLNDDNYDDGDNRNIFNNKGNENEKYKLKINLNEHFKSTSLITKMTQQSLSKSTTTTTKLIETKENFLINVQANEDEIDSEGISLAIILLITGISLTIGVFVYFIISSKYANKTFRWPNFKYKNLKNTSNNKNDEEYEADYLI